MMKKFNLLILFLLIFFFLLVARGVSAKQEAYMTLIEYSIDDPEFGNYDPATGKGVIAWIEDTNGPTYGGKVYKVAPGAPTKWYGGSLPSRFNYEGDKIAKVDTTAHSELYARYTVKNTGDDPIEALRATLGYEGRWGRAASFTNWVIRGRSIQRLGYLFPNETKYEISKGIIQDLPEGYLWKPIRLGWSDSNMMPNEDYYYKAIIYADGPDFSPPGISCEYTSQKIVYNGTYSNTCTYRNFSSNTVYLKLEDADFYSHLAGTWHARYREAVFRHDFDSEIITLNPYQTLRQDKTATINEIDSPDTRNVNLSLLDASYRYSLCLDSSCSQILENLSYSDVLVTIGYGTGKYLGVQDPGAFSTTSTELGASPAYNAYFNLRNPNTRYNETVDGDDYDIDIQIIKDGDKWYQDASTAVRHYKFLVKDLNQEPGVRPVPRDGRGDPIFRDDNGRAYSFFYKIPDIDQIPSNQLYKLYITTIWKNHPRTGLDEPIDQVKRSFAPGLDLELEDVYLPAGQNTVSTFNNSIWNFGSFPVDIEIKLLQNVENFSISTSLPIKFTLGAGDKINFQIDFEYSGSKPSTDVTGNLTGSSLMEIVEEFVSSDFDSATITIEKSGPPSPPTAHNLFVTPPNSTDYCPPYIGYPDHPPVRVNWEFYDPGDSQSAFKIEVDDDPDFRSLAAETGRIFSSASSYVFQKSGERLSWGKTYYWSLKVWDRDNKPSDWIYPPNPPGETTLRPGTPFQTTHPFPEPDFDWLPEDPTAKEVIQFTDLSQFHDSSKSWFWNFGDGQSSTDQNPTHSYSSLGNYNIILTVTDSDDYGCSLARTLGIGMQLPEWREIPPF